MTSTGTDAGTPAADLLIEIGCEELPPKALDRLRESLFASVCQGLEAQNISFDSAASRSWSSPRRLALSLAEVAQGQPDVEQERRGPAVSAAWDADGNPTPAAEGFARSVGLSVDALQTTKNEKGEWLYCRLQVPGKPLAAVLQSVLEQAVRQLPIPRPMRWSDHEFTFVRPVHWLVALHGDAVLPITFLGHAANRTTRGHRIHSPGPHELARAQDYLATLERAYVIADQDQRRERIRTGTLEVEPQALIEPALLDEVTNLVEWPVAIRCTFDASFLQVPHAALVASMQDHQKFFPVREGGEQADDSAGAITNAFVAVANLDSQDVAAVRAGFERVIRPRLADAQFFYEQDQKRALEDYHEQLDRVVYQEKIGTIGDKSRRIAAISREIAEVIDVPSDLAQRAAHLAKCDLVTQMVGEFPELQGTMGCAYATLSGETREVAEAIGEHYFPRFSGDAIPGSAIGQCVSLADRTDTLVGIFAAGLKPSGNRDPFALRRAALGLVRILLEARLPLNLHDLLAVGIRELAPMVEDTTALEEDLTDFIVRRAHHHFVEQGHSVDLINAVSRAPWTTFHDLDQRLRALSGFMGTEGGASLAAANKRIGNILRKAQDDISGEINVDRFVLGEEERLFSEITDSETIVEPLVASGDYEGALGHLVQLREPVDRFFDEVMVMDEDTDRRVNRLALLTRLKLQFDQIADLSVLS